METARQSARQGAASVPVVNSDVAGANAEQGVEKQTRLSVGASSVPPEAPVDDEIQEYEPLTPELVEEEALRGDVMLQWAVVLLAVLLASTQIGETATLVHVKTGQYLASHGILPPKNDVFSYTAADRAWLNLSWAFDLFAAGVHAIGGFVGLSLVKAVVVGAVFWVVVRITRPETPTWWGSVCAALALVACHERFAFLPTLATLAGTALVLHELFVWQQGARDTRRLWLLVPLMVVWSNLDSRAFLGLATLLLFAAGETLQDARRKAPRNAAKRKQLWQVVGACLLAVMLNPFLGQALLAPWHVYGIEYPAFREYIGGTYLGTPTIPSGLGLLYFPLTTDAFWKHPGIADIAAIALMVVCGAMLLVNIRRIELAQVFVYFGFVLFALAAIHELAVASLVFCVLATLGGQAWYAANCRQTYSVASSELLFSRGGRVLTVLAFSALALFGGTGRLRGSFGARTGYGLDGSLAASLDDLTQQLAGDKSYDRRPFNFRLSQGDQLIWVGQQVFADNRVALYYATDPAHNLLAEHIQTREALLPASGPDAAAATNQRNALWRLVFGQHEITHIVPRLDLFSPGLSDYLWLAALAQDERHWRLTSLGTTSAVLYRNDLNDPALKDFLAGRQVDFRDRAFRHEQEPLSPRGGWVRPPSVYQRYLWSTRRDVLPEVQEATHLVRLASFNALPAEYRASPAAMAYLAIRLAQAGLSKDPDSVYGYLALGQAYQILMQIDSASGSSAIVSLRYIQAVAAYNQALVADPDNETAHIGLIAVYRGAQRLDLWLRHVEALERLWRNNPRVAPEQVEAIEVEAEQLRTALAKFSEAFAELPAGDDQRLERVRFAQMRGCVLAALEELDAQNARMGGNLAAEQIRIGLLMEAGREEEAHNAAEMFSVAAKQAGAADFADTVARAQLPAGDYARAQELWKAGIENAELTALNASVVGLPWYSNVLPWPISTIQPASNLLYALPQAISQLQLTMALALVEEGQLAKAEEQFAAALASDPETAARRLIAFYLAELTGEEVVEPFPPSERIPALFAPESDDEPQPEEFEGRK